MNAGNRVVNTIKNLDLTPHLLGLILSTLLLGYVLSSIFLGIFVAYVIYNIVVGKYKMAINLFLIIPIALYVYFSFTYFWSVDKEQTLRGLVRSLSMFLVPFMFFFIPRFSLKDLNFTLNIFSYSNLGLGILFLISSAIRFLSSHSLSEFYYHDLVSVLELNAIYVSAIFSISFFHLLGKENSKTIDKIGALFLFLLIILMASKNILFITFIGVVIFFFWRKPALYFKKYLFYAGLISLALVVFSKPITNRILQEKGTHFQEVLTNEKFNKIYPWTGTSIRLLQLRILKEQIKEEGIIWTGFGLAASNKNLIKRHKEFNTYSAFHQYNYHNAYAQSLSETGAIGLLFLLLFLGINLLKGIKSGSFIFLMSSLLMVIWPLTESVLSRQRGIYFFIILICVFNHVCYSPNKSNKK
jgi:O-antigen ligase|tara:strand:+ start:473 stop:1711 length:1239 start_codon:yes stop_codon:yes gene_type:complete